MLGIIQARLLSIPCPINTWRHDMANTRSSSPSKANEKTEAEAKSADGKAGKGAKSSHDSMSHVKAGSRQGAGGGKKQERHH
jgi:hypothetical protein